MDDIFIRLSKGKEATSQAEKQRAFKSIPYKIGFEVVFKPYGEQGQGFYYSSLYNRLEKWKNRRL